MHPYHGVKESFMSSAINSDLATTDNKGYFNPPIENYRSMYKYYDRIKGTQVTTENDNTSEKAPNANNALRLVPNRQQYKKKVLTFLRLKNTNVSFDTLTRSQGFDP